MSDPANEFLTNVSSRQAEIDALRQRQALAQQNLIDAYNSSTGASSGQLIATALASALPAVIGGLFGGKRGLAAGAAGGAVASKTGFERIDEQGKTERELAKLVAKSEYDATGDEIKDINRQISDDARFSQSDKQLDKRLSQQDRLFSEGQSRSDARLDKTLADRNKKQEIDPLDYKLAKEILLKKKYSEEESDYLLQNSDSDSVKTLLRVEGFSVAQQGSRDKTEREMAAKAVTDAQKLRELAINTGKTTPDGEPVILGIRPDSPVAPNTKQANAFKEAYNFNATLNRSIDKLVGLYNQFGTFEAVNRKGRAEIDTLRKMVTLSTANDSPLMPISNLEFGVYRNMVGDFSDLDSILAYPSTAIAKLRLLKDASNQNIRHIGKSLGYESMTGSSFQDLIGENKKLREGALNRGE